LFRGLNNEILDSYMLKSLDGLLERDIRYFKIVRLANGKLGLKSTFESSEIGVDNDAFRAGYDKIIRCMGFRWDDSIFNE